MDHLVNEITVVTYLNEKHKQWLPHWCDQLNKQTVRGFKLLLIFHNWESDGIWNEGYKIYERLDKGIGLNLTIRNCYSEPVIGGVINYALHQVKTKYFAHWDVDDVFHPQRFERQAKFLAEHSKVDFLNARALGFKGQPNLQWLEQNYVAPNEPYANVTTHNDIYSCLVDKEHNPLTHGLMIYRTEVMKQLGGFDMRSVMTDPLGKSPDMETWKKALLAGKQFYRLSDLLMLWRLDSSAIRDLSNIKE